MLGLSSFDFFADHFVGDDTLVDRRDFLRGTALAGILPFGFGRKDTVIENGIEIPANPLKIIREKRCDALAAVIRAQIDTLWCGRQGDDASQIVNEILVYVSYLPRRVQHGINMALLWMDGYSAKHAGGRLKSLSPQRLRQVLNQGEYPRQRFSPPLILWEEDHLLHLAVSGVTMLGRMVIHSRTPARNLIGLGWSEICERSENLVQVERPPLADLSADYDVCIIGSGAGGATMANRLSAAGKRVLIIDLGDFVSPDALIQKIPQPDGSIKLAPPRSDEVLYRLYKDAGGQIAGGLGGIKSKLDLAIPARRRKMRAPQTINICQAKVFGGGPYVNNAIHLPIPQEVYDEKWLGRQPTDVPYETMSILMSGIKSELGVNTEVTDVQISDRSMRFKEGCEALGEEVQPLPVAMRKECLGCGSDNSVDSFGDHVGGIHPYSPNGANSFLVQAMHNPSPAAVSYRTTADRIRFQRDQTGALQVQGVDVRRIEDSGCQTRTTIKAKQYVVAAGVGATTKLLSQSLHSAGLRNQNLGKRLSANVGTAVYAMFDKPIWPSGSGRPEPGVTQCFLVDRRMIEENGQMVEEPALENWFHFPGTVALALCGWFKEFACVMKKFNHLSMSGIVVPTQVRRSNYVDSCGKFHMEVGCDEFELLLRGMRRIARIYFAAAKPGDGVTLFLPTKSVLMRGDRPAKIRCMADFEWALCQIRKRGPAYINLLTTHPQGGASLGDTVDPTTFQLKTDCGERVENLTVSDASIFPAGCEINPQLTVKALSALASEQVIKRVDAA